MKKIFLLLLFLCATKLYAQDLYISSNSNLRFWVYINSVLQNARSVTSLCIKDLPMGVYQLDVELDVSEGFRVGQRLLIDRQQAVLQVENKMGLWGLKSHSSIVNRPEVVISYYRVSAVDEKRVLDHVYGYAHPCQGNSGNMHPRLAVVTELDMPHTLCMDDRDFSIAVQSVEQEIIDNARLQLAKQIVLQNALCVSQIVELCNLLSFERNKLEFAKFAYPFCAEPHLYVQVNEVFSQQSSKRQLTEFLSQF